MAPKAWPAIDPEFCRAERLPGQAAAAACARTGVVSGARVDAAAIAALARELDVEPSAARRLSWLAGARPEPAAAIILIGGRSLRMGTDKAFIPIDGVPVAARLHRALAPHFDDMLFAAAAAQPPPVAGVRCVSDAVPGQGPLAGLAVGLAASPHRVNFVIACDIPEIDFVLMRRLLSCLEQHAIAVPAFTPGRTEPLFGAYDRAVGATAARLLAAGSRRVLAVYDHHPTRVLAAVDTGWYANLNTPDDLRRYLRSGERNQSADGGATERRSRAGGGPTVD